LDDKKSIDLHLDVDREKIKRAQKVVNEYEQKLKEANSLADELASMNLDIKFLDWYQILYDNVGRLHVGFLPWHLYDKKGKLHFYHVA